MKSFQKRAAILLVLLLILWGMLLYYPIRTGFYRAGLLVLPAAILTCATLLLCHRRWLRWIPLGLPAAFGLLLLLPGRQPDPLGLRAAYVRALQSYTGTRYVWGGENRRGVDCSGLLRTALVDAHFREAFRTLNPALARDGLWLWWHDESARDMSDQWQGCTRQLAAPAPLKDLVATLHPGDIAVTADGSHVLAALGDGSIIEADPVTLDVMTLPADSPWWRSTVIPCRWSCLE